MQHKWKWAASLVAAMVAAGITGSAAKTAPGIASPAAVPANMVRRENSPIDVSPLLFRQFKRL